MWAMFPLMNLLFLEDSKSYKYKSLSSGPVESDRYSKLTQLVGPRCKNREEFNQHLQGLNPLPWDMGVAEEICKSLKMN